VVVHAFDSSTRKAEAGGFLSSEFKAILVYKVSSRRARAIQRNPVSKKEKKKKKKKTFQRPYLRMWAHSKLCQRNRRKR
jgi:hypothetical protein